LKQIGVSETDFLRECDASFKQGSKFIGWVDGSGADAYYHPFALPVDYVEHNLAPYWLDSPRSANFADSLCFQTRLCEQSLAPKQITTPEFAGLANYAYHLDAGKFAPFLQKHWVSLPGTARLYVPHYLAIATCWGGYASSGCRKSEGSYKPRVMAAQRITNWTQALRTNDDVPH
jgi:hypothetical protein